MSTVDRYVTIDPSALPKIFDNVEAEERWGRFWVENDTYRYDPSRPRDETFVVDTPPPTVSGSLHVGHVFSYTHTDIVVRYQRMRGRSVFYPIGWDDNGLPTERRVQNLYHVRCDPRLPYDPSLALEHASAKQRKKPAQAVSRPNFIELCHAVTEEDEKGFEGLMRRIGLSVDWEHAYATIDDHCRHQAQLSFLDLFEKGHVYNTYAPTMWDVDFQTAVAQAEMEDKMRPGAYHHIEFGVEGQDEGFTIATTRPELLAACVGVTAHPEDARYKGLFGKKAVTPLFRVPVPIFPSEVADPEKGTGILMVCTFGDATDVDWWRSEGLALRQLIGMDGRLMPVEFGSEAYPTADAAAANRTYGEIAGKNVKQAQKRIVELLAEPEGSATGKGAPLQREPEAIEHAVRFYERGDRPLEIIPTRQWFVRLLDKKEALLAKGDAIHWHPEFMGARYRDWTEHLGLDWCVSRQRYFGVPIPVWYPLDMEGEPDFERAIAAAPEQLPVDPTTEAPKGYDESQRDEPGGFSAEADVFDTWFTSSMTPQISSHWRKDAERHAKLFPADIRPQSHEIIRTWAFYTIAKALLHEDEVPWRNVLISGWVLDPDRKKMSKSVGNVVTPMPLIEKFSADAVRYWSGSARLGSDAATDDKVFKVGRRLATKMYNAGKFVLSQTADPAPVTDELDRAFLAKLRTHVARATEAFDDYGHARVLADTESFFWTHFTDTYIELAKSRARDDDPAAAEGRGSAVRTLRTALSVLLRLFAPFQPYVTEEVWSWAFAEETGEPSIHRASWPSEADFAETTAPANEESFELAATCWRAINKAKADAEVSVGREVSQLEIAAAAPTLKALEPVLADVLAGARVHEHALVEKADVEAGAFEIPQIAFVERPE